MRQALLVTLVVAAGLTVGAAVVVLDRHAPPPAPKPTVVAGGGEATATLPPPETAAPEQARPKPAATPAPATAEAVPPAPAKSPDSDLPNVNIAPRTVHAVPDAEPPSTTVTIVDRNGRTIKQLDASAGLSPTYVPSVGPGGAPGRGAPGSTRPPPGSNAHVALALPGAVFNGKGSAIAGATVAVSGHNFRLFGVKLPGPGDRCGLGNGDNRSCSDVARDALAQRLQRYLSIACRVPPGQRGTDQAAICTDNSGTDLAGFLIGEGYALADTTQSFDYFGAEGAARSNRRGLWRSR